MEGALASVGVWLGNLVLGWILGKPRVGIRLDTMHGPGILVGGAPSLHNRRGVIWIHNASRVPFTVREAGWTASDGATVEARFDSGHNRTLVQGGPELRGNAGASKLMELTREHRGIVSVYVTIVGRDKPHTFRMTNEWRQLLAKAAGEEGVY